MRSEIILAIAKKDLLEVKQNTSAWLPMVIVPLMFAVGLPLIILLAPRNPAFMNQVTADPDLIGFIDRLPPVMFSYLEGLDLNQKMVVIFLGFFFAPELPRNLAQVKATDALDGSLFRMLRQGQRVVFEVTDGPPGAAHPAKVATTVRLGSEIDMGTPGFPDSEHLPGPAPETRTIRHEGGLS